MEAGLAIVIIAIVLDRLSQAIALQRPEAAIQEAFFGTATQFSCWPLPGFCTTPLSLVFPALTSCPTLTFTTAPYWKAGVDWSPSIFSMPLKQGGSLCCSIS